MLHGPLCYLEYQQAPGPYIKKPDMQYCGNKGNYLHFDPCIGLCISLFQPTNHNKSSQLVLGVWVIGWFSIIIPFGTISFRFSYFGLRLCPPGTPQQLSRIGKHGSNIVEVMLTQKRCKKQSKTGKISGKFRCA